MSLTNPNTPVSQQDLQDFYHKLLPYLGGSFGMIANKFSKGDLYSTDEKMIGQWIDGKPLYQKSIEVGTLKQASQESYISLNTPNVDKLIKHDGVYFEYSDNNEFESVFHLANSRGYMCPYKNYANNSLYMAYKLTFDLSNVFVTVQYTKTTDSPISIGDDTDYSTEEKIVGTWIDGSPLYQITHIESTPLSCPANTWVNTTLPVGNISRIIDGFVFNAKNSVAGFFIGCTSTYVTLYNIRNAASDVAGFTIQYTKTT